MSDKNPSPADPAAPGPLATAAAANVRHAREARGWSRAELAARSSLSEQAVWQLESARRWPREETILAIARALGIGPQVLFLDGAIPGTTSVAGGPSR